MVTVQAAACTFDEAIELMQARARQTHRTLEQIAVDVLGRSIRFGDS